MKMIFAACFPNGEEQYLLFGTNYKENIHTLYSKVGSINIRNTKDFTVF